MCHLLEYNSSLTVISVVVELLCNAVLVSAAQQVASAICMHSCPLFKLPSQLGHHRTLQKVPSAMQHLLVNHLLYTWYQ